ncbi:MAG: type III secretion system chaperone [Noviherbaspirillum sp.]
MARLRLDGTLVIDFEFDAGNNALHLYSTVAPARHDCEAQLRLLMEANLFLDRSVGTTFALDSLTGEFICCVRLEPEKLRGEDLVGQVERMADAVERLRADLAALEAGGPAAALDTDQLRKGVLRG